MKKMGKSKTTSVTSTQRKISSKKKSTRKKSSIKGDFIINPLTGKKEKVQPLFHF